MYRITTTKTIGGVVADVPMITCDSLETAQKAYRRAIDDTAAELDAPRISMVGGHAELLLEECEGLFDTKGVVNHATIKRPLHSPKIEVFEQ